MQVLSNRAIRNWLYVSVAAVGLASLPLYAANCSWVSAPTAMSFNGYSVFTTPPLPLPPSSSMTFNCNGQATATITLTTGQSNSYLSRTMSSGTNKMTYNVLTSTGQVFGNGTNSSVVLRSTPGGVPEVVTMTGQTSQQDLIPGTYADTLTAHLSFCNNANQCVGNMCTCTSVSPDQQLSVSVTIAKECRINAFSIDFGQYDPFSAVPVRPLPAAALNVYCTRTTSATLVVDNGQYFDSGSSRRRMKNTAAANCTIPANCLGYELFRDSGYSIPWFGSVGAASSGSAIALGAGPGYFVFGSLPAGQDVYTGNYLDSVGATVTY